jgi:DNA-binding transcriptional LysR family regulator
VKYPAIQINLRSLHSVEQIQAIRDQSIDVGITSGPITGDDIESELVERLATVAILPSSSPLAKLKVVSINKLVGMAIVRPSNVLPVPNRIIDEICRENGVSFTASLEGDNLLATLNAVASGAGFALVPEHASQMLTPGVVAKSLEMKTHPVLDLLLAYRKDNLSPVLQLFLRTFHDYMQTQRQSNTADPN